MKRWTRYLVVLLVLCSLLTLTANADMPWLGGKNREPLDSLRDNRMNGLADIFDEFPTRTKLSENIQHFDQSLEELLKQEYPDLTYVPSGTVDLDSLTGKNAMLDGCDKIQIDKIDLSNLVVDGKTDAKLTSGSIRRLYVLTDDDVVLDIGEDMQVDELILASMGKIHLTGKGNVDTTIALDTPEDLIINIGTNLINLTDEPLQITSLKGKNIVPSGGNLLLSDDTVRNMDAALTVRFRMVDQSAREMGIEADEWDGTVLTDASVVYTGKSAENCPVAKVNVSETVAGAMKANYPQYTYALVPSAQYTDNSAYRLSNGKTVMLGAAGIRMTTAGEVFFPVTGGTMEVEFLVYVYRYGQQDGRITYRLRISGANPEYFTPSMTLDSGAVASFTYDMPRGEWYTQLNRSDFAAGEQATIRLTSNSGEQIGTGLTVTGREEDRIVTLSWTANTQRATINAQDVEWESPMPMDGNALLAKAGEYVTLSAKATFGYRGIQVSLSNPNVKLYVSADGKISFVMPYEPLTVTIRGDRLHTLEYRMNRKEGDVYFREMYTAQEATLRPEDPKLAGYTFVGWYENADGTGEPFAFGTSITEDTTLYAIWELVEYTVTLDANGGDPIRPMTYTVETPSFTLPTPIRLGYTFDGWTGEDIKEAQTDVTIAKGNIGDRTYTAAWSVISYTVTLDANGGDALDAIPYTVEDSVTLPTPTRTGYEFLGWVSADGETPQTTVVLPVGTVGDKTYTAQWQVITYTLTLDPNNGEEPLESTYTCESGNKILPILWRNGYIFEGWTGEGIDTPRRDATILAGSTGDRTYTAHWQEITYHITIQDENGKTLRKIPYTVNSELEIAENARTGYEFLGYTDEGLTGAQTTIQIAKGTTGDKQYTARWQKVSYTISCVISDDETQETTYDVETEVTLSEPTRLGYEFLGWTGEGIETPTKRVTIPQGSTGNKTYTTNWQLITYRVSFTCDDGTPGGYVDFNVHSGLVIRHSPRDGYEFLGFKGEELTDLASEIHIPRGTTGNRQYTSYWKVIPYTITCIVTEDGKESYTIPYDVTEEVTLEEPVMEGYEFLGWTGEGINTPYKGLKVPLGSTGNRTYTANWKEVGYSVTLRNNDGSSYGTTRYLTSEGLTLPTPTRDGYSFLGWTGEDIDTPQTTVTIPEGTRGEKTYTANWEIITYSITIINVTENMTESITKMTVPTQYYTVNSSLRLTAPIIIRNYDFIGYTGEGITEPQFPLEIPEGSTGNRTYYAHWEPNP